jgi:hypothetical protein
MKRGSGAKALQQQIEAADKVFDREGDRSVK